MSSVSISEAPTTGVGRLITDNRFYVPTHQRDYKWDRDRVQKFIDDLTDALDRDDKFYFIGLMVFMRSKDGRLRVLDGQQRLATTIIFFSALRAWFASTDSQEDSAKRIQYDFIGRAEYGEKQAEPKLSLNRNNDDMFQKYVINGSPIDIIKGDLKKTGRNAPNYDLLNAVVYCHQRISEIGQKFTDVEEATKYFSGLIKFLRDSVIAVRLTVPNESNAFRVFETLNDRGMDLSAVDLIKNHLFGLAHDASVTEMHQLEHRWGQITQILQNMRQEDFLKVYWTSRHGLIQLDDIFDAVKSTTDTSQKAAELSQDLLEAAQDYAAIDDPNDNTWNAYTHETRDLISNLKTLGSKLVRPVVMSGMKKLEKDEFKKLLRVLEVIVVRWQVVGEGRTGTIERTCARLAELIWTAKVKNRADIVSSITELNTSDEEFTTKFISQENLTRQKAVYLLRKIEEHVRSGSMGQGGKGLKPALDISLEHILPTNPGNEWNDELSNDPSLIDLCDRTGNFCLLPTGVNRDIGNLDFNAKKKVYAQSDLLTTQQVANYQNWNEQSIISRQTWLASKAVAIWRLE